jgi:hypothetical protein
MPSQKRQIGAALTSTVQKEKQWLPRGIWGG